MPFVVAQARAGLLTSHAGPGDTIPVRAGGIPVADLTAGYLLASSVLAAEGFEVLLVDPSFTKQIKGRPKTDKHDSMWIQRLHGLGLLSAAFRPEEKIRVWRSYQRHRANLIDDAARHLQRLQKALEQMNVKLTEVVSDVAFMSDAARLSTSSMPVTDFS